MLFGSDGAEPHRIAGGQQGGHGAGAVEQRHRAVAQDVPAPRADPRVDDAKPVRDGDGPRGHLRARFGAARQRQSLGQIAHEGQARQETQRIDNQRRVGVLRHDVGLIKPQTLCQIGQIGCRIARVAARQVPHPALGAFADCRFFQQDRRAGNQVFLRGLQAIVVDRDGTECRSDLCHPRKQPRRHAAPQADQRRMHPRRGRNPDAGGKIQRNGGICQWTGGQKLHVLPHLAGCRDPAWFAEGCVA